MVAIGNLKEPVKVESLLYDAAVREAYQELVKRPELQPAYEKVKIRDWVRKRDRGSEPRRTPITNTIGARQ